MENIEKILIEYVCPSLELIEENFNWDMLDNKEDEEIETEEIQFEVNEEAKEVVEEVVTPDALEENK